MKILFIIHDNKRGGASLSFLEMVSEIRKKHEVFVIVPHRRGFLTDQFRQLGIRHTNAHYFWWMVEKPAGRVERWLKRVVYFWAVKINQIEAIRVAKRLQKEKFDLIHSNSSVINFGGLLARSLNLPHVWHVRELAQDFNFMPVMREKTIYSFMKNRADRLIAISYAVGDRMKELTHSDNVMVIYNGVDEKNSLKKSVFPKSGDTVNFLIAGNICKEKGQMDAVMACGELRKRFVEEFHLFIAGDGVTSDLEKYVRDNHLDKYVTVLGKLNDMRRIREQTDVEIVGTRCEAFGRVTIEAMRSSNPVIGTDSGGTKELVSHGRNGFLYSYGDCMSLAGFMECFIRTPGLVEKMGKQAYQDVKGKFTPKENADKIMEMYDKISAEPQMN